MTLEEVAVDTHIKGISIDYVTGMATFDLQIWVADDIEEEPEVYRNARLILSDLLFCVIEPPDPRYDYHEKKPLWVGDGSHSSAPVSSSIQLPSLLPENAFSHWFFVNNWNSFIHVAAMDARLEFS
jgi:hypothetical protein